MLIEEQIKIARLIASGTPREVAISESTIENMTDEDIKNTGANAEMQAKLKKRRDTKRAALALRKKNQENRPGAIVKSKPGTLVKTDAKKDNNDNKVKKSYKVQGRRK